MAFQEDSSDINAGVLEKGCASLNNKTVKTRCSFIGLFHFCHNKWSFKTFPTEEIKGYINHPISLYCITYWNYDKIYENSNQVTLRKAILLKVTEIVQKKWLNRIA